MRVFENAKVIDSVSQRECYTKHGLHLNSVGKEQMAYKIIEQFKLPWKVEPLVRNPFSSDSQCSIAATRTSGSHKPLRSNIGEELAEPPASPHSSAVASLNDADGITTDVAHNAKKNDPEEEEEEKECEPLITTDKKQVYYKMASVKTVSKNCSRYIDQTSSVDETNLCANCFALKDQIQVITAELKSAQLIFNILQNDFNSKEIEPITSKNATTCVNSNKWEQVPTNKTKTTKTSTVKQLQPQPIRTIINRYAALNNLQNHVQNHHPREHDNSNASQERYGRAPNYNKTTSDEKRRKIIIIGDSHTRGCAQELQHYLGHNFVVQGFVKPGANLQTIVNAPTKTIA